MALTTDFDILVSHKGKDQGRKEKRPLFFTIIHGIPKQISDTAQSIGINEKTRKNGLMSGVILPSQVAHDRWLSTYDAIFDATFLVVYFSLSSFGYFFAYKYDIKSYLLKPIEYYEKATSYVKKTDLFDKIKLKKEKDETVEQVVSNRFSSEATLKKEQKYKEKQTTKDKEIVRETPILEDKEIEKNTKSILFDDFIRFLILSLGFLIYFYYVYKYAYNHYEKRKIKNLEGVDVELKTDLELKMEEIKKLM